MAHILIWVVVGLGTILGALIVAIVVRRAVSDRRRARNQAIRPAIEAAMAGYLAGDDPDPPTLPDSRGATRLARAVALDALAELKGAERERLITLLERSGIVAETAEELQSRRVRVRRSAAESLGQIGSAEAAQPMLEGLNDPDLDVRLSCASGLAELGDERYVAPILSTADEAAGDRPGAAAAILVTVGGRIPSALAHPLDLRSEFSPELRRLAAAVVGALHIAQHAPLLRAALGSDDPELVARAARGLGMIGDMDATAGLLGLMQENGRPWFVHLAATEALGALGDPAAVAPLERELTQGGGWSQQSTAAQALRCLGVAGEAVLDRALASDDEAVRGHALVALER